MLTTPWFVAFSIFFFVAAGGLTFYLGLYADRGELEERLNDLAVRVRINDGVFLDEDARVEGLGRMLLNWAVSRLPAPSPDTPKGEKLAKMLAHAGFNGPGVVKLFQLVRLGAALAGGAAGLVASLLIGVPPSVRLLYVLGGVALGGFIPGYYVGRRMRSRQAMIARELSDILDLLTVCVESGLGIYEAIKVVGREAERQGRRLGAELSLLSAELNAGSTFAQGLRSMAERTGVDDVKSLAAILIQSEKLGSQMAPALRASSDSMRIKRRLRAEEAAQKSTIKMLFPLVFFVLPAMMIVIIGPAIVTILHTLGH